MQTGVVFASKSNGWVGICNKKTCSNLKLQVTCGCGLCNYFFEGKLQVPCLCIKKNEKQSLIQIVSS
jgi:hypothetical protein